MLKAFLFMLLASLLVGCSNTTTTPEFGIAPGRYAATFDAAREVLRDYRFQLERVDAQLGVISTQPKPTGGLVSMWDREQSTLGQEVEDTLNNQTRIVRVTFTNTAGDPVDPIDPTGSLRARVEVTVYRRQTPGLRVASKAVSMPSTATDPERTRRGVGGDYTVPVSQDTRLAVRLAGEIERRSLKQK